jgi:hypothetical protein
MDGAVQDDDNEDSPETIDWKVATNILVGSFANIAGSVGLLPLCLIATGIQCFLRILCFNWIIPFDDSKRIQVDFNSGSCGCYASCYVFEPGLRIDWRYRVDICHALLTTLSVFTLV